MLLFAVSRLWYCCRNALYQKKSRTFAIYWEIGKYINQHVLEDIRAEYGKKILSTVSTKLVAQYGKSFEEANLYRMKRFATVFSDLNAIADFASFLSWSHFCEIMRIKDPQARLFYAKDAVERQSGIRELRRTIARKAYERTEIANMQLTVQSIVPFNVFKDSYLLDVFDLKDNFLENDLENATDRMLSFFSISSEHLGFLPTILNISITRRNNHQLFLASLPVILRHVYTQKAEQNRGNKRSGDPKNRRLL